MNSHVAGQLSRNVGKVIDEARNEPYVSEIAFVVHPRTPNEPWFRMESPLK